MSPKPEAWGGEVHMPRWLRKALHRPDDVNDTPEAAHEKRRPQDEGSVLQNANRAASGSLADLYNEDRRNKGKH
jgi:hypothetical protein